MEDIDEEEEAAAQASPARDSGGDVRMETATEGQPVTPATNASGENSLPIFSYGSVHDANVHAEEVLSTAVRRSSDSMASCASGLLQCLWLHANSCSCVCIQHKSAMSTLLHWKLHVVCAFVDDHTRHLHICIVCLCLEACAFAMC